MGSMSIFRGVDPRNDDLSRGVAPGHHRRVEHRYLERAWKRYLVLVTGGRDGMYLAFLLRA